MDTREVDYPVPTYPSAPTSRPKRGLLISTIALTGALILSLVVGAFMVSGVRGDLDSTQRTLATTRTNLHDAQETVTDTEAQLADANGKATACAKAADLLSHGADGYVSLWNELDDAADRWNFVFAFYLRGIMHRTNVTNTTLEAGWDALDACQAGSSTGTEAL